MSRDKFSEVSSNVFCCCEETREGWIILEKYSLSLWSMWNSKYLGRASTSQCQRTEREEASSRDQSREESPSWHTSGPQQEQENRATTAVRMLLMQDRVLGETVGDFIDVKWVWKGGYFEWEWRTVSSVGGWCWVVLAMVGQDETGLRSFST